MQNLLQAVVILISVTTIYGCTLCPHSGQFYNGKCYWVRKSDQGIDWFQGFQGCLEDGGELAVIYDESVNFLLLELVRAAGFRDTDWYDLWFGLFVDEDTDWEWVDFATSTFNYQNFDNGIPAPASGQCGCMASPPTGAVDLVGQWAVSSCDSQFNGYLCQSGLSSTVAGECGTNSLFCAETLKCYCYVPQPKTWEEAKECCEERGATLAIINDNKLNTMCRNLAPNFASATEVNYGWIGLTNRDAGEWEWCDDSEFDYNNFNGIPAGNDLCAAITNADGVPGRWAGVDCEDRYPFYCESDRYTSACCDPHFMVTPIGMTQPVCFDYYGDDGDVVQLIASKKYDLAINARVFSHEHTKKTWFASLSIVFPECEIVAVVGGVNVNGNPKQWKDIEDVPCGTSGVTYSIREDLHRDSTHLIIHVMPGVEFIFSKDQKTYKFGTILYMDFDMTKHYGLDETTDGILGEFMGMRVNLDEDSVRNDTETAILYFPDEPGRGSVTAHRVGRKNLLTNKHFHCWNVEDEGAGLVRGTARDYLVPNLLTGQRAQKFLQEEDEEAADATF